MKLKHLIFTLFTIIVFFTNGRKVTYWNGTDYKILGRVVYIYNSAGKVITTLNFRYVKEIRVR